MGTRDYNLGKVVGGLQLAVSSRQVVGMLLAGCRPDVGRRWSAVRTPLSALFSVPISRLKRRFLPVKFAQHGLEVDVEFSMVMVSVGKRKI